MVANEIFGEKFDRPTDELLLSTEWMEHKFNNNDYDDSTLMNNIQWF